jgi:hypothetical protein
VIAIDKSNKPKVSVQESINNAKIYCRQNPTGDASLRDYSGGVYNKSCAEFQAEQRANEPTTDKPGPD